MDTLTLIKDVVVALAAFIGAGLGIFNYFQERKKSRVSLKVIPKALMSFGVDERGCEAMLSSEDRIDKGQLSENFAIKVINLSSFPVQIDSVGLLLHGTKERMGILDPTFLTGAIWPARVESRASVTVHGRLADVLSSPKASKVRCAYAETSCGHVAEGSSRAFEKLLANAK
jgi:hypothetical protein